MILNKEQTEEQKPVEIQVEPNWAHIRIYYITKKNSPKKGRCMCLNNYLYFT